MTRNEVFGRFKDSKEISVGRMRRMKHSFTQKLQSMSKKELAVEVVDKGGLAAGVASAGASVAASAGATSAFVVAMSGPQAAVTLTVLSAALAAKSAYSDRESAHNALAPYVWSYIDDAPPKGWGKKEEPDVLGAAMSLISDGKAQISLVKSKFEERERAFNAWYKQEYLEASKFHVMGCNAPRSIRPDGGLASTIRREEPRRQAAITSGEGDGGAVREYMRRLVHMGNYLQAGSVVSRVLRTVEGVPSPPLRDFAQYNEGVTETRRTLAKIAKIIQDHDALVAGLAGK